MNLASSPYSDPALHQKSRLHMIHLAPSTLESVCGHSTHTSSNIAVHCCKCMKALGSLIISAGINTLLTYQAAAAVLQ